MNLSDRRLLAARRRQPFGRHSRRPIRWPINWYALVLPAGLAAGAVMAGFALWSVLSWLRGFPS